MIIVLNLGIKKYAMSFWHPGGRFAALEIKEYATLFFGIHAVDLLTLE